MNCLTVSDMLFSSDGKLFDADGPAADKLQGPKPTVLILAVVKLVSDVSGYGGVSWVQAFEDKS